MYDTVLVFILEYHIIEDDCGGRVLWQFRPGLFFTGYSPHYLGYDTCFSMIVASVLCIPLDFDGEDEATIQDE